MPRRSALKAAAPRELNKAISEIEQRIAKAVKEAGLIDRNTGKPIEGDVIAVLARISHDPNERAADRVKAASLLLDRVNPAIKPEPAQGPVAAAQINIRFQPIDDDDRPERIVTIGHRQGGNDNEV